MVVTEERVRPRPESIPGVRIVILWIEILCWCFLPIFERAHKSGLRAGRFGEQENPAGTQQPEDIAEEFGQASNVEPMKSGGRRHHVDSRARVLRTNPQTTCPERKFELRFRPFGSARRTATAETDRGPHSALVLSRSAA